MNRVPRIPFQLSLHLGGDSAALQVFASSRRGIVPVWLDEEDFDRLGGRRLSLGSHGYPQVWHEGQATPIHRWIMGAERGDGKIIDHVNGDPYDNRKSNLRFVTAQENAANRRCMARSGYRGVYASPGGRWTARVKINGRSLYLGTYRSPQEAAGVSHNWRLRHMPGYLGRDITTATTALSAAA